MLQNKPIRPLQKFILFILLAGAFFIPRLSHIGQYVTADEAKWLMRSGNFYYALATGDFAQTYQREHPGVTIMWAGAAAYFLEFPDYVRFGPDNFTRPQRLQDYLEEHQQEPLEILALARGFMVLASGTALLLAWLCMISVISWLPATLGFLLIALDPFYLGLSRLLHLDALSSTLMVLSISAWAVFIVNGRKPYYLILSGVAAGLSWLTKSPSFFLIPMIGLIQLGMLWKNWRSNTKTHIKDIWRTVSPARYWFLIGAGVFVLLWPAMWVDPLNTLQQVITQATSYVVEGHESRIYFMGEIYDHAIPVWYFYPVCILLRTTPVILTGLILALIAALYHRRVDYPKTWQLLMLILTLFAGLFLLLMSLSAKKFDRYIVPVFLSLDILAGFGWAILLQGLTKPIQNLSHNRHLPLITAIILGGAVLGWQMGGTLATAPYYLTYYNPLVGGQRRAPQILTTGWGEGIDQAARYLNTLPEAYKLTVAAWYGEGCFSYYFEGTMMEIGLDTTAAELSQADYAVIYIH